MPTHLHVPMMVLCLHVTARAHMHAPTHTQTHTYDIKPITTRTHACTHPHTQTYTYDIKPITGNSQTGDKQLLMIGDSTVTGAGATAAGKTGGKTAGEHSSTNVHSYEARCCAPARARARAHRLLGVHPGWQWHACTVLLHCNPLYCIFAHCSCHMHGMLPCHAGRHACMHTCTHDMATAHDAALFLPYSHPVSHTPLRSLAVL